MERFVRLDKDDFVGKAATLNAKQQGPRISLVYFSLEDGDAEVLGNEPIFADGQLVGVTTSGGYGYATKKSIAFGYVKPELVGSRDAFEVEILGSRRKAFLESAPVYDPGNDRLRA